MRDAALAQRGADAVPVVLDLVGEVPHELEARDPAVLIRQAQEFRRQGDVGDLGAGCGKADGRLLQALVRAGLHALRKEAAAMADARREGSFLGRGAWRDATQHVEIERDVANRAREDANAAQRAGRSAHAR